MPSILTTREQVEQFVDWKNTGDAFFYDKTMDSYSPVMVENPSGNQRIIKNEVGDWVAFREGGTVRAFNVATGDITNPTLLSAVRIQDVFSVDEMKQIYNNFPKDFSLPKFVNRPPPDDKFTKKWKKQPSLEQAKHIAYLNSIDEMVKGKSLLERFRLLAERNVKVDLNSGLKHYFNAQNLVSASTQNKLNLTHNSLEQAQNMVAARTTVTEQQPSTERLGFGTTADSLFNPSGRIIQTQLDSAKDTIEQATTSFIDETRQELRIIIDNALAVEEDAEQKTLLQRMRESLTRTPTVTDIDGGVSKISKFLGFNFGEADAPLKAFFSFFHHFIAPVDMRINDVRDLGELFSRSPFLQAVASIVNVFGAAAAVNAPTVERLEQGARRGDPTTLPTPQDLVRFELREVFRSKDRALQLNPPPSAEFLDFMKLHGFEEFWSNSFWAAHWELPALLQGFEMFHRLRPGKSGVSKPFTRDDLQELMKKLDILPAYHNQLIDIAYQPLTRVDIRRMYKLRVIGSFNDLKEAYLDIGYNDVDAGTLARFTQLDVDDDDLVFIRSRVVSAYENNLIDDREFEKYVLPTFRDGSLYAEFKKLVDLERSKRLQVVVEKQQASQLKTPTEANIKKWLKTGLIAESQAREFFSVLKYSKERIDLLIREVLAGV